MWDRSKRISGKKNQLLFDSTWTKISYFNSLKKRVFFDGKDAKSSSFYIRKGPRCNVTRWSQKGKFPRDFPMNSWGKSKKNDRHGRSLCLGKHLQYPEAWCYSFWLSKGKGSLESSKSYYKNKEYSILIMHLFKESQIYFISYSQKNKISIDGSIHKKMG